MPFNGSGTFTRDYVWVNDKIAGTPITASRVDDDSDDFAFGLSSVITKDGQTLLTGDIPFANFKITGLGNGSARNDSIALGQVQDNQFLYLGTTSGSADAYTLAPSPTITAYAATQQFTVKISATNLTTTPYLQISSIVAPSPANPTTTAVIKKLSATKTEIAVEASDLLANGIYKFQRNSANDAWIVLNPEKPFYNFTNGTKATSTLQGILALTPNKTIYLSNNTTDATNDIDASAGWFNFDDGSGQAYYAGGTGQLDVLFSAGGNGMLDASTIANTTYHIFLIYNPTTAVSKLLASTSVSSPTLPSGYTKKVRIGSIIRASSAILPFRQSDKQFFWTGAKITDKAVGSIPTTSTIQTLTVPTGIAVDAISIFGLYYTGGSTKTFVVAREPSEADTIPSITNFDTFGFVSSLYASEHSTILTTRTNTSSQIAIRGDQTGVHTLNILAKGYIDYQLTY